MKREVGGLITVGVGRILIDNALIAVGPVLSLWSFYAFSVVCSRTNALRLRIAPPSLLASLTRFKHRIQGWNNCHYCLTEPLTGLHDDGIFLLHTFIRASDLKT